MWWVLVRSIIGQGTPSLVRHKQPPQHVLDNCPVLTKDAASHQFHWIGFEFHSGRTLSKKPLLPTSLTGWLHGFQPRPPAPAVLPPALLLPPPPRQYRRQPGGPTASRAGIAGIRYNQEAQNAVHFFMAKQAVTYVHLCTHGLPADSCSSLASHRMACAACLRGPR